ncbi:MAG: cell division protein ZipA [Bermanella sp.]
MDISLHSFILVVGVVVITFIVWDGIKRLRDSRSNQLDNHLDILGDELAEPAAEHSSADYEELEIADDLLANDFLGRQGDETLAAETFSTEPFAAEALAADTLVAENIVPEPQAERAAQAEPLLDDTQAVPVLMEPVELGGEVDPNPPQQHELQLPKFVQQTLQDEPINAHAHEPSPDSLLSDSKPVTKNAGPAKVEASSRPLVGEKLAERAAAQEIIVINVFKDAEPRLLGEGLLSVFKACDLRHGEMGIFHRFERANAQGKIQFSVVNALQPGAFNLDTMGAMSTPGISLFMSLPGPQKPMEAFDAMSEVAQVIARNFTASLYDESHSDLTPQTLEHYRNRVREFTRKHIPLDK